MDLAELPYIRFPEPGFLRAQTIAAAGANSVDDLARVLGARSLQTLHFALMRVSDVEAPCGVIGFFSKMLPHIAKRAGELHEQFPFGLRALCVSGQLLSMTRKQAACLLCCMFLDMFPKDGRVWPPRYSSLIFNEASFISLFAAPCFSHKVSSLQLVLRYFENLLVEETPRGSLYFRRLSAEASFASDVEGCFDACDSPMGPLEVHPFPASIESATGALQADFANSLLGGGTLRGCAVQEEIRFATCPECIVGMLVASEMEHTEAILITGAGRFALHRGYNTTLEYDGPFVDKTLTLRESGLPCGNVDGDTLAVTVVAFDAEAYPGGENNTEMRLLDQLRPRALLRELLKATVAFGGGTGNGTHAPISFSELAPGAPIATGNWGCGAFNGNAQIKAIIQWLAASISGRAMLYYPFGDPVGDALATASALVPRGPGSPPLTVSAVFRALSAWAENFREASAGASVQYDCSKTLLVDIIRRAIAPIG